MSLAGLVLLTMLTGAWHLINDRRYQMKRFKNILYHADGDNPRANP